MSEPRWIDLHLHSTASDGAYEPARLMEMAHARGLSAVALTDHDTVAGHSEAAARAAQIGLEFIPGIELEAAHGRGAMHILGYFVDATNSDLIDFAARCVQHRETRKRAILERLAALGIQLNPSEFEGRDGRPIGRPHIAMALVRAGVVPHFKAAFDEYLGEGKPAFVPRIADRAEDAIAVIRAAGGVASLAHPVRLGCETLLELRTLARHLKDAGLAAIETHHPSHSPAESRAYSELASGLGLCETGGSDFHALPPKQGQHVGFAKGRVAYDLLSRLRERASMHNP